MATIKFTIPDAAILEHLATTHGFARGDANSVEVEVLQRTPTAETPSGYAVEVKLVYWVEASALEKLAGRSSGR